MSAVNNFISDYKSLCVASFGIAIIGFLGFQLIKHILEKVGIISKIDTVAISALKAPINPKNPKTDLSIRVSRYSNPGEMALGKIDLIDSDNPRGITQYSYPTRKPGENIPQACSYHSANAILFMAKNFNTIVEAFKNKNIPYLNNMRRQIIDEGLASFKAALRKGAEDNAIHPENLENSKDPTNKFNVLNLNKGQSTVITGIQGDIDSELDKLFQEIPGKKCFSLLETDGQTFAFFQIDKNSAFLFDSHKSWFSVVSKQQVKTYIENDILHLTAGDAQSIDFFNGVI